MVSRQAKDAIAERIISIAVWREERANQDMLGFGPEVSQRSQRSSAGLRELADFIRALPDEDPSVKQLTRLAFSGGTFDPGASLLNELGRFRFHDADTTPEQFLQFMVTLSGRDAKEQGRWGGPQIAGDDPWGPSWVVDLRDPDEDEEDW